MMAPVPGEIYAFLLDIAGEDETVNDPTSNVQNPTSRDSTALTIVRIDLSQLETLRAPRYQVVMRRLWTGVKHTSIFGQILALAESWSPRYIVCDSTGVGAGIASFMVKVFGEGRVIPFIFTAKSKSELGWNIISVIETGRFQDYVSSNDPTLTIFQRQLEYCQSEILPGPGRMMRWSVPDGTRDPATGELVHDDLIISAALCSVLDEQTWGLAISEILPASDPISTLDDTY